MRPALFSGNVLKYIFDNTHPMLSGCVSRFSPFTNEHLAAFLPYPEMKENLAVT